MKKLLGCFKLTQVDHEQEERKNFIVTDEKHDDKKNDHQLLLTGINNLPSELLNEIQGYIPYDRLTFRLVCKNWSNIYCEYLYIKLKIKHYDHIKHLCNENQLLLLHASELSINYRFTTKESKIINQNNELFKNIKKFKITANASFGSLKNLFLNSNSFIYNLNEVSIYYVDHTFNREILHIYNIGARIAAKNNNYYSIGMFSFSMYENTGLKIYLDRALELDNIPAIKVKIQEKWLDQSTKLEWLEKGAKLGNSKIQFDLAEYYYRNGKPLLGLELFEKVYYNLKHVEKNNKEVELTEVLNNLISYNYSNSNYEKAIYYSLRSYKSYASTQRDLALCYQKLKDYTTSFKCNWKVANFDNNFTDYAQFRVAYCYEYGIGIEKDLNNSFKWYLKASNNKYEYTARYLKVASEITYQHAIFNLSYFYCNGLGTLQNMEESINYLIKSRKYSVDILKFLKYFNLLNHFQNSIEIQHEINENSSEDEILEMFSPPVDACTLCNTRMSGFYYSTNVINVCKACYNEETLEKLKHELENRTLFKTHILVKFIPLLEYCKECNNINNQKLDNIINQLRECNTIH